MWTKDDLVECNWNNRGVHAIFITISFGEFKHMSMCEATKESWDILKTTHDGIKTMKKI